jgi:hypothetical protein
LARSEGGVYLDPKAQESLKAPSLLLSRGVAGLSLILIKRS